MTIEVRKHFPHWLKKSLPAGGGAVETARLLERLKLATICQSAKCPNIYECFSRRIATIMILGSRCTRNCRFCAVGGGAPAPVDEDEPRRVAEAIRELRLRHVVITSVTRDDLPDGGAAHFANVVAEILAENEETTVEVLTPDFAGRVDVLWPIIEAGPVIFGHNMETIPRLYPSVRPGADYVRSLRLLESAKKIAPDGLLTKSGLMVGLGEALDEVLEVLHDLREVGCDIVTVGQYLQPTPESLPVEEFVAPETFRELEGKALRMGFHGAFCGPFVRSSYLADRFVTKTGAAPRRGDGGNRVEGEERA
jgi:lipoic acid synthetase